MGIVTELPIISAPSQRFETVLSGVPCEFTVNYSAWTNRWSFDLALAGVTVLQGRRMVIGPDLIAPFRLGIGKLVLVDWGGSGAEPGRTELPSGQVRLLHYEENEELA